MVSDEGVMEETAKLRLSGALFLLSEGPPGGGGLASDRWGDTGSDQKAAQEAVRSSRRQEDISGRETELVGRVRTSTGGGTQL